MRNRRLEVVKPAFEDLMNRFHTDYMDLGMIHYIDADEEYDRVMSGPFMEYVRRVVRSGRGDRDEHHGDEALYGRAPA